MSLYIKNKFFENLLLSFITGILLSYFMSGSFLSSYTLEKTAGQSLVLRVGMTLLLGFLFYFFSIKKYLLSRFVFVAVFIGFISATLLRDTDPWTQIGFCALTLFVVWMLREPLLEFYTTKISSKLRLAPGFVVLLSVFLFSLISIVGILRYLTFRSADFDLGLFSQIFESMRKTGQQLSTIERDQLMSHFGVHVSPLFYLILPVYALFPSPITLQVIQALFVAISLWPLYLLCKHYRLTGKLTITVLVLYTLYPALSSSCFNDFHENCALPFFLLFLIWAFEKERTLYIILFTTLTFSIKEDAVILVGCLAFYYILAKKQQMKAIILLSVSILYFGITLAILNYYGNGMLGYMTNFTMNEKNGLAQVLTAIVLNPGYSLLQCFNQTDKIFYLAFLLLPLGSTLLTTKYCRYILLIPFFLMNLMPYYSAVYTLGFQYHFGVSVFLFYLLIMNLSERDSGKLKTWGLLSLTAVLVLFIPTSMKTVMKLGIDFMSESSTNAQITEVLDSIPEGVSVNASPKLVPYFYQYEEIYPITSLLQTDYVIFDRRPDMEMYEDEILEKYYSEGYEQIISIDNVIEVYRKSEL